jgi:hypothetical protein
MESKTSPPKEKVTALEMEFLVTSEMEVAGAKAAYEAALSAQQMIVRTIFRRHEQDVNTMRITAEGEFEPIPLSGGVT